MFFSFKEKKKEGEEGGFLEQIISVTGLVKNSVYRSTGEWSRSKWNLWLINCITFKENYSCGNIKNITKRWNNFTNYLTALKCNWKKKSKRSEIRNKKKHCFFHFFIFKMLFIMIFLFSSLLLLKKKNKASFIAWQKQCFV